jgi:hypothetical protein
VGNIEIAAENNRFLLFEFLAIGKEVHVPFEGAVIEATGAFVFVVVL